MYGPLKILHHEHTARLKPHEHTSYLPLAFLLLLTGAALAIFSFSVYAATPYTGPEAGSIGLSGEVPGPPPKLAATIDHPTNGQHLNASPITVSGTCSKDTLVEIFKNNIFAGSALCQDNGAYSLQIDLLFGQNTLTAQIFDTLNQAGPESKLVTVFYDSSFPGAAPIGFLNISGKQLLLSTDAAFRGSFPNQSLNVPITVIGGTAPYAINVQWGDSNNSVMPRNDNSTFNTSHAYKKPGTYQIILQGTDSKQLVAFLTVAAIINGKPDLEQAVSATKNSANKLLMLWPVFALAVATVVSFWLGEKREKKILKAHDTSATPAIGTAPPPTPPQTP